MVPDSTKMIESAWLGTTDPMRRELKPGRADELATEISAKANRAGLWTDPIRWHLGYCAGSSVKANIRAAPKRDLISWTFVTPKARLPHPNLNLVVIEFSREDVEAGYVDTALARARYWSMMGAFVLRWRCGPSSSPWDDDIRETAQIPEIRDWFAKLSSAFPTGSMSAEGKVMKNAHVSSGCFVPTR